MAYAAAVSRPPPPPKDKASSTLSEKDTGCPSHHATDPRTDPPAVPYDDERSIWIYVDDSNIWITAKKLAAKKMKTKEDHRVRIDVGRLTDVVAKGREVACMDPSHHQWTPFGRK